MSRVTTRRSVERVRGGVRSGRPDTLAVEEPLEIRVGGRPLAVTMRTPGDDMDLAAGFLVSEGVVSSAQNLATMRFCAGAGEDGRNTYNVLDVELAPGTAPPTPSVTRSTYTTSSCGVCGKASLDAVRTSTSYAVADDALTVPVSVLTALPERLRARQKAFDRTGGVHAAGLFSAAGEELCIREDVGRHNAVDKVVGWALRENQLPLRETVLLVSSRASFELVQKAWMAGIPVLAAVSAPSSLAVELAEEAGMTLVGFLRDDGLNIYAGGHRVV